MRKHDKRRNEGRDGIDIPDGIQYTVTSAKEGEAKV